MNKLDIKKNNLNEVPSLILGISLIYIPSLELFKGKELVCNFFSSSMGPLHITKIKR